jgi:hypothetical protein
MKDSYLNAEFKLIRCQLILRIASHVLQDMTSCPVSGTTNQKHENISDRIAGLWAQFLNPRPHKYEVEVLTT